MAKLAKNQLSFNLTEIDESTKVTSRLLNYMIRDIKYVLEKNFDVLISSINQNNKPLNGANTLVGTNDVALLSLLIEQNCVYSDTSEEYLKYKKIINALLDKILSDIYLKGGNNG